MNIILVILIGIIAGGMSGLLGVSAAFFIIMSLSTFGLVSDYQTAAGTTLLAILPPIAILAVIEYWRRGKIDVKMAMVLSVGALIGGGIGAKLSEQFKPETLKIILAIVFLLLSIVTIHSVIEPSVYKNESGAQHELNTTTKTLNFGGIMSRNLAGVGFM